MVVPAIGSVKERKSSHLTIISSSSVIAAFGTATFRSNFLNTATLNISPVIGRESYGKVMIYHGILLPMLYLRVSELMRLSICF
jgi:hypothetical protein